MCNGDGDDDNGSEDDAGALTVTAMVQHIMAVMVMVMAQYA
jgi:hypothetical protein